MALPQDLVTFLSDASNRTFKLDSGEIREVTLYPENEIPKAKFDVARYAVDPSYDGIEDKEWLEGYDLVKACNAYHPSGIMIWFPDRGEFGQHDDDHHKIVVFPKTTWSTIMESPALYFSAMWGTNVPSLSLNPWA